MATLPVQLDEKTLIAEQIAALPLPDGIRFLRVEDYEDWTGEPSYRAYFSAPARLWPSEQERRNRLSVKKMTWKLRGDLRLPQFLYVQFIGDSEPQSA